ncbi:MAG: AI-2E family transporter [Anaerovoracaceae bacterium]
MSKFREVFQDRKFMNCSLFLVVNAILLYALYFIIKNFDYIAIYGLKGISALLSAFSPLFIGLVLAYILNPLVGIIDRKLMQKFFFRLPDDPIKAEKKKKTSRFICVLLTFLIIIAAIVAILYGFAAMIMGQLVLVDFSHMIDLLINSLTQYEADIRSWISSNLPNGFLSDKMSGITQSAMGWFNDNFSASAVVGFFASAGGSIVNIGIGVIISMYLMNDRDFFVGLWRKFLHITLPQRGNAIVTEALGEIDNVLSRFIRGSLLDALCVAILSSIGLSIAGLEFGVFIGVFAGIANVIPYFGPVLGMIPAFIVGFLTDGLTTGVIAVVILLVVQQIDSNILYPKIVGSSTGLHPLVVLLSVSVFGYFAGIIGMLLAVPLAGIVQVFVVKWANSQEAKMERVQAPSSEDDGAENSKV